MNKYIDHTLLKPEATSNQIMKLCEEARQYEFKSVCINPCWVSTAHELLKGSDVLVCTVIGFPLGNNATKVKAYETTMALNHGAHEVDMVINVGSVKDGDFDYVYEDIKAVVEAASGRTVKVILETCLLTNKEIEKSCEMAVKAGAHFVKTSTGFNSGGASKEAVSLMIKTVQRKAEVKASGGIRSYEDAKKYIDLGATRLGVSSGVAIMNGQQSNSEY